MTTSDFDPQLSLLRTDDETLAALLEAAERVNLAPSAELVAWLSSINAVDPGNLLNPGLAAALDATVRPVVSYTVRRLSADAEYTASMRVGRSGVSAFQHHRGGRCLLFPRPAEAIAAELVRVMGIRPYQPSCREPIRLPDLWTELYDEDPQVRVTRANDLAGHLARWYPNLHRLTEALTTGAWALTRIERREQEGEPSSMITLGPGYPSRLIEQTQAGQWTSRPLSSRELWLHTLRMTARDHQEQDSPDAARGPGQFTTERPSGLNL